MFNKNNNKPVKIGILEISTQNKSILEFFFSSAGKTLFKEVNVAEADAFIIDYDFPGAKESWETTFNTSGKPGIILSIHEVSLASAIWVSKPLTAKALTEAGQKLKEILQEHKQIKEKPDSNQSSPAKKVSNKEATEITTEVLQSSPSSQSESPNKKPDTPIKLTLDDTSVENIDLTTSQEKRPTVSLNNPKSNAETDAEIIDVNADIEFSPQEVIDFSIPQQTNDAAPVIENPESVDFLSSVPTDKAPKETHKIRIPTNTKEPSGAEISKPETNDDLLPHREASTSDNAKPHERIKPLTKLKDTDSVITNQEPVNNIVPSVELPIASDVAANNEQIDALLESLISGKGTNSDGDATNHSPAPPLKELKETNNKTNIKLEDSVIDEPKGTGSSFIEEDEQRSTEEVVSLPEESFSNIILEVSGDGTTLADDKNVDTLMDSLEVETVASMSPKSIADMPITDNTNNNKATPKKNASINKHANKSGALKQPSIESGAIGATSEKPSQPKAKLDTAEGNSTRPEKITAASKKKAPLTPEEELQRLLDEIRKEADTGPELEDDSVKQTKTTFSEKRRELIFGDWPTINKPAELKKISFKPEEHILQTFMQVLDQAKASKAVMRLKFKNIIIVIDIKQEAVYCDFSLMDEEYAEICFNIVDPGIIKIHTLDKSEIRLYRKKMIDEPKNTHSFEAFIWITSLLTARGRLPENTDINQKIGIKYWPNLTRLESIPHAIQIAAALKKHPGSLLEVPRWLNLPQSAVFAFYNGVLALDIIERDQHKLKSLKDFNKKSNKKNRGFFSRLLKRITK